MEETLGPQRYSTFPMEEALYKGGHWTSHSPLVLLALGWSKIAGQEGKQLHSQTQRSGNWGKGIFPSGLASYSFARPLQGYQGSQGVWGQFPVRSPRMYPTHKSLNS